MYHEYPVSVVSCRSIHSAIRCRNDSRIIPVDRCVNSNTVPVSADDDFRRGFDCDGQAYSMRHTLFLFYSENNIGSLTLELPSSSRDRPRVFPGWWTTPSGGSSLPSSRLVRRFGVGGVSTTSTTRWLNLNTAPSPSPKCG